jgi:hypothetical protein
MSRKDAKTQRKGGLKSPKGDPRAKTSSLLYFARLSHNRRLSLNPCVFASRADVGLKSLTERDVDSNEMLECFDFNQKPLPPHIIKPDTKLDFSDLVTTQP